MAFNSYHRAVSTYLHVCGPWRESEEEARKDCETIETAYPPSERYDPDGTVAEIETVLSKNCPFNPPEQMVEHSGIMWYKFLHYFNF
jgi:hypothetical protein